MLVNAMKLYGPGWTDEDIQNHQDAVKLENAMNTAIEKLFNH
jgi:hypothetical protein